MIMKNSFLLVFLFAAAVLCLPHLHAQELARQTVPETLIREGIMSVSRGVDFLLKKQNSDGSFCDDPAITALCMMAIDRAGEAVPEGKRNAAVNKARSYILKFVQKDGSIQIPGRRRAYPTYSTAIALTALATLHRDEDKEVMLRARKFLLSLQLDEDNADRPTQKDDPKYGGFGYGPGKRGANHVDLSNTQWVAEALYASEYLIREPHKADTETIRESELAWDKLEQFVTKMQHLPQTNKSTWVVSDPNDENYGGFVYQTEMNVPAGRGGRGGKGKTEEQTAVNIKTGRSQTLRSYGSMTYAGLKSMIYAKVKKDDPRVKAAVSWAHKHYTLDENPGLGSAGHYYYLQTFAKAHSALGMDVITTGKGEKRNWRADLIGKLLSFQRENGEWYNENNRYMERLPELVTAYSLITMEFALSTEL